MAATTGTDKKEEEKYEMEYVTLGGTGLVVSRLGFGSMSFNSKDQAKKLMAAARKQDINFFDNAELYGEPLGSAETYFGEAYKELLKEDPLLWRRSDLVITTKLFFGPSGKADQKNSPMTKYGTNEKGTSMKHIHEGMIESLKRLQLDYVDVVFAHRWDSLTSVEETVRAFTKLIKDGKAFYWGTSMWTPQKITEAYWVAKINGLIPPVVEQPIYNMFNRNLMESDLLPMYKSPYNIGTTIWSPLDSGILTGKYIKEIPKDSRGGDDRLSIWYGDHFISEEDKNKKVIELINFATFLESNIIELALAWVLKNKNVSVCILGASKPKQIDENVKCIALAKRLTKANMENIDKILGNAIKPDRNLLARTLKQIINTDA